VRKRRNSGLIENTKSRYTSNATSGISLLLAAIGLVDAGYLTWIKLTGSAVACSNVGNCEVVNNSRFSAVQGIPIALFGTGAYLLILILLGWERLNPPLGETTRPAVFGLTFVGSLYSAYLTYVELAILRAICPYCLASAMIMTLLFVLSIARLRRPWVEQT
jgi:uncharacterized membrane protein